MRRTPIPAVVAGLCDDAAVFPPGLAPLPEAVRAYRDRQDAWYAEMVGPFVLAAHALPDLAPLLPADERPFPLSLTFAQGPADLPEALAGAAALPIDLRSVEIAVPDGVAPDEFVDRLGAGLENATNLEVYVEVPRDDRRFPLIDALAGRYRAKFRTGGVHADRYLGEAELAAAVAASIAAGVPFKATAGLHHAIRNTDPETGFEQHGFLNLLLAVDALTRGGTEHDARALLTARDARTVADQICELDRARVERVRSVFTAFGTCSITDPLTELIDLGVVTAPLLEDTAS